MDGPWREILSLRFAALIIETCGSVVIAGYSLVAFAFVALHRDRRSAQRLVATGVLNALSLMLSATLLKTLSLTTWNALGSFAVALVLRLTLKRIFVAEQSLAEARADRCAQVDRS